MIKMKIMRCQDIDEMNKKLYQFFLDKLSTVLMSEEFINIGIATGKTFEEFMKFINNDNTIQLQRINLFMVDEYVGVDPEEETSCAVDLINAMSCLPRFHKFCTFDKNHYLDQIEQYNAELLIHPFDILLLGIGQDGHFAFCNKADNESKGITYAIIDFSDEERQKQVAYGWFDRIEKVPYSGITLTAFGAMNCRTLILAAKYEDKKVVIESILNNTISERTAVFSLLGKKESWLIYG